MHLVLLHGYLLQGTGSNIYVANIARAWKAQGHGVTVICQDRQAGDLPFVDEIILPGESLPNHPPAPGTIRVVVPFINDLLPVYVMDRYDGYTVKLIPDMTREEIETHIQLTALSVHRVASQGVQLVLANHALFGPVIARRGLVNTGVPYRVKIHGSAIEYTLVPHPELMSYAVEGLAGAERIFVGTRYVKQRVQEVFSPFRQELILERKLAIVPPGMDPDVFNLAQNPELHQRRFLEKVQRAIRENPNGRKAMEPPPVAGKSLEEVNQQLLARADRYDQRAVDTDLPEKWQPLRPDEPLILYFGKFIPAKGVGEIVLSIPRILQRIPQARFVFVGFGSYREHLEGMLWALRTGDREAFRIFARAGEFVEDPNPLQWFRPLRDPEAQRVVVTGILDHDTLRELLPLASVVLVPSKWPEAFGMVAVEAMAAGVLPLCNYHAGLKDVVDEVQHVDPGLANYMKLDRKRFVQELPDKVEQALQFLYPDGFSNHSYRKKIAELLRDISVRHFSWEGIARRLLESDSQT